MHINHSRYCGLQFLGYSSQQSCEATQTAVRKSIKAYAPQHKHATVADVYQKCGVKT